MKQNKSKYSTYILHNPNTDEIYVGSGVEKERKWKHKYSLDNNNHHNRKLQKAYNSDQGFKFMSIPMDNREDAYNLEQIIINKLWGNPLLLNISDDVRAGKYEVTPKIREKMRIAKLGVPRDEETKRKIGLGALGNTNTRGRKLTPEHVAKVVSKTRGQKRTPEQIETYRICSVGRNLGRKLNTVHKEKIGLSNLGRKHTDKAIGNFRKAALRRGVSEQFLEKARRNGIDKSIKVIIDNVIYDSVRSAARDLYIDISTLRHRLNSKSKKFTNWNYLIQNNKDDIMAFVPEPRTKNALDNRKLNLVAPTPGAAGKFASLIWGLYANNPRITVYTNDPADTGESKGYGKISANLDLPIFFMFLAKLNEVIDYDGEFKQKLENKNYIFPRGQRSEKPVVVSELWFGKDKDGIIWLSVTARDRPKIKFPFAPHEAYHSLQNADGTPVPAAEVSKLYAKAYVRILESMMIHMASENYLEPKKPEGKGGSYSGNKSSSSSHEEEDIPF